MSNGQTARYQLPGIANMEPQRAMQEIQTWGNTIPIGFVGFLANGVTATYSFAIGVATTLTWNATDYESDNFFQYDATPKASVITIPPGLGGIYGWKLEMSMNSATPGNLDVRCNTRDSRTLVTTVLSRARYVSTGTDWSFLFTGVSYKVLNPGDIVAFSLTNLTSAVAMTFNGHVADTIYAPTPQFSFYRLPYADYI